MQSCEYRLATEDCFEVEENSLAYKAVMLALDEQEMEIRRPSKGDVE